VNPIQKCLPILFALGFLAPGRLRADLAWTEQAATAVMLDGKAYPQTETFTRVALKGNAAKIEDRDQAGIRYYNFYNSTAVFYSLKSKTFLLVPFRDLLQQARAQEQQVRQDLDNREAVAGRLAFETGRIMKAQVDGQRVRFALKGLPFRLEPTAETKTLLGHSCRKYLGYAGDRNYLELWVAQDLKPGPEFKEYAEAMMKLDPVSYQHLLAVPGIPLLTHFRYGPVETAQEVKSLSTDPLPLEEFLLPAEAQPALP
jgi:hypothetical protein